MSATTQTELALARKIDEREHYQKLHEDLMAAIEATDEKTPNDGQKAQLKAYREKQFSLDAEIAEDAEAVEATRVSVEASKRIRSVLAGSHGEIEMDGDEPAYRTMAAYARDIILTSPFQTAGMIAAHVDKDEVQRAAERLQLAKRTPANTLSSNVGGLIPPQHINQIYQVIDSSRPMVATAQKAPLERGTLTYPVITTPPVVAVQNTQKTEAGNTGMQIDMVTATASTYLGGGDLSWQAINWSTPNALDLWFRLVAADYALKTETDAATVVSTSGYISHIGTLLGATPTFAQFMTAVGAGAAAVWTNSGRTADTVYMAPDRFWYIFGTTSDAFAQFTNVSGNGVGPLNFVPSRGLNSGEIIVGDSQGLLVAETPGAPVELRVVEPAIGGVEVGLIGAFEAVVVDDGAFATITTAS